MDAEDEEETTTQVGHGRPNAWWAQQREREAAERRWLEQQQEGSDNFTASFRGVKNKAGRGGTATVKDDDTIGDYEHCWCGLVLGHDWPGKASGRKHPKGNEMPTDTAISRGELRAYHDDLAEIIIQAVNTYGCRHRTANNSIMIYPPDGSRPFSVYARNSDRQAKSARSWFIEHVLMLDRDGNPQNPLIKDGTIVIDDFARKAGIAAHKEVNDDAIRALAEKVNSPEHKPTPPKKQATVPVPPPPAPRPPAPKVDPQPQAEGSLSEQEWHPHVHKGRPSPNYETRITAEGVREYRCIRCREEGKEFITNRPTSLGGHVRQKHTDTTNLYAPEARKKAATKQSATKKKKRLLVMLENFANELGVELPTGDTNTAEVEALRKQVAELTERAETAETKLQLIREASGL